MFSNATKAVIGLALVQSVSAKLSVAFTTYGGPDCTTFYGTSTLVAGYCVNFENFPEKSYGASATSGACDDASKTPVLKVFADPNCETGLVNTVPVGAEPICISADVTLQSANVACV
ncbi:uncharacterized protein ACLA_087630 [Aspergillus clavatus NRRL 1]|uniref:Uncharacterized protein n=1 Tax=Aspergillus clavatus (strain ATCC 1007 / CBS 513.65 / DSM 816 / NCTC 3887 / NRRL 1 / QM 1276 / 107) TaxID=344612 RepID=A1CUS0_ASPCL|nr:uncharacterized protein ACLA_087630 [Aspergillus clavatus NRRL 1]EAW07057.1 hypothetical protein ACLA_087630 [Aspergillus clavatus NRRL 1]